MNSIFALLRATADGWSLAADIATTVAGLLALLGVPFALLNYYASVRTRRAEWLSSLHESFFETARYAVVRRILDYKPEPEYGELRQAIVNETQSPVTDEFYRYLNFFELLASLQKLKEISDDEIMVLFEYDLRLIASHDFVVRALTPQGFERLREMIKRLQLQTLG